MMRFDFTRKTPGSSFIRKGRAPWVRLDSLSLGTV
jgi:hypothetical protein